jgi:hypothetical protein
MDSTKYIGMDVHKEAISIAVMNSSGRIVMESIIETKAGTILQFMQGLRGNLEVTFEEGTGLRSYTTYIEHSQVDHRYSEEIDRDDFADVTMKECFPCLRGRSFDRAYDARDGPLRDLDS